MPDKPNFCNCVNLENCRFIPISVHELDGAVSVSEHIRPNIGIIDLQNLPKNSVFPNWSDHLIGLSDRLFLFSQCYFN